MRLNQKHSRSLYEPKQKLDGRAVITSQSISIAVYAALLGVAACTVAWMLTASLFQRVFPWFVLGESIVIGLLVRYGGRGFDWRFSLIAAIATVVSAYCGNFLIAADSAANALQVSLWQVVLNMSEWTMSTYFDEDVSSVDHIYAAYGAAVSAFFARRRLSRAEVHALRTMDEAENGRR